MSEESTTRDLEEAVRRSVDALNRREYDRVMTLYAPDVVWDAPTAGGFVFEGREVLRGFFEDWVGAYEDYRQEVEEFRDLGNGVTFNLLRAHGQPRGSSGVVEFRVAVVATWADGLVQRLTNYSTLDEARDAAERLAKERC